MHRSTRAQDRIVDILALMQKQACLRSMRYSMRCTMCDMRCKINEVWF